MQPAACRAQHAVMMCREVQEAAGKVGRVASEAKLGVDVNEFVQLFRPEVMQLFHEWALGAPFSKVLKMSDYFEVRLVRLNLSKRTALINDDCQLSCDTMQINSPGSACRTGRLV